jgi:hypothetical protein
LILFISRFALGFFFFYYFLSFFFQKSFTTLSFLGLPNIHSVRDTYEVLVSYAALATVSSVTLGQRQHHQAHIASPTSNGQTQSNLNGLNGGTKNAVFGGRHPLSTGAGLSGNLNGKHVKLTKTDGTSGQWSDQWLELSSQLISAATTVAQHSEAGDPVLIHCRCDVCVCV